MKNKGKIFKIILFIGIFIIFNQIFSSIFISRAVHKSKAYKIDSHFERFKNDIEIIALGDSHASSGFDPRVFEKGFNFSIAGENYIYNYYKLKYALKNSKKIKTIVLPIDLHTFSTWKARQFPHDFYWIKYVDYYELGLQKNDLFKFFWKYVNGRYLPYIGEYEMIFKFGKKAKKKRMFRMPTIIKGFVVKKETFYKKKDKATRKRIFLQYYKQKPFDKTVTEYFKKILRLSSDKNKILVLVRYPVTKLYYKYASKKVKVKKFYEKIEKMSEPYKNIIFLDFHNLFFENDSLYFYDPDHLNYHGARIFTEKIKKRLKSVL